MISRSILVPVMLMEKHRELQGAAASRHEWGPYHESIQQGVARFGPPWNSYSMQLQELDQLDPALPDFICLQ